MTTESNRANDIPWPPPWGEPKPVGGWLGAVFFAAFAVVGVVVGVSLLWSGATDPFAYVLVALIPFFVGVAFLFVALRLRTRTRGTAALRHSSDGAGGRALSVPFQLPLVVAFWLSTIGALPVLLLIAAASLLLAFTTSPPNIVALVIGVLLVLVALPMLLLVIDGVRGKAKRGELWVSPQGVRYRAWSFDAWMPWEIIESVSISSGEGQPIVITGYSNMPPQVRPQSWLLRPGKKVAAQAAESLLVIRGVGLAVDPAVVLYALRYYHQNPVARTELGTDAAVQRVRSGSLT